MTTTKAGEQPTITQALKPCPFCKSEAKHFERHNPMSKWRHSVDCEKCGASGPVEATKAEAISAWNTRTTSLAAQDGLVDALQELLKIGVPRMWKCERGDYCVSIMQKGYFGATIPEAAKAALSAIKGDKS